MLTTSSENSEALALIIDGKSLFCALEDDVKDMFLELALGCASVICCRSSPKQKALVSFSSLSFMFSKHLFIKCCMVCQFHIFYGMVRQTESIIKITANAIELRIMAHNAHSLNIAWDSQGLPRILDLLVLPTH